MKIIIKKILYAGIFFEKSLGSLKARHVALSRRFFAASIVSMMIPSLAFANEVVVNQKLPSYGSAQAQYVGPDGVDKLVTYENKGGYGLFEGDIYIPKDGLDAALDASNGVVIDGFRWPNNTLHYRFDNVSTTVVNLVRQATAHISSLTNVRFVELASNATSPYHVRVQDNDHACYSHVGKRGSSGNQVLNVVPACGFGATVHEFLHALGMWHEQSREDRNSFVRILLQNVEVSKRHNFNQQINGSSDIGGYDYGSIMHYGSHAFSINGQPTIVPIQTDAVIGNRSGMSIKDVETINRIYPGNAFADLTVESAAVNETNLATGQLFAASATLRNSGSRASTETTLRFFSSTDSVISTADTALTTVAVSSIGAGAVNELSVSLNAPTAAGTYWIGACVNRVASESNTTNNCSSAVQINVAQIRGDDYEPDDSSAQASPIQSGVSQVHSIAPADDVDWVKITLPNASPMTIETSDSSGDTRLWLYDNNLDQIAYNDDIETGNLLSKIEIDEVDAGIYFVKVDEFNNDNLIAAYTLTVTYSASVSEDNDLLALYLPALLAAETTNKTNNMLAAGIHDRLLPQETKSYKYKVNTADSRLTVNLDNLTADIDLYVYKDDKKEMLLCSSTAAGISVERCVINAAEFAGWFYIDVNGYESGSYTLSVIP